jgi:hypothetical protein
VKSCSEHVHYSSATSDSQDNTYGSKLIEIVHSVFVMVSGDDPIANVSAVNRRVENLRKEEIKV